MYSYYDLLTSRKHQMSTLNLASQYRILSPLVRAAWRKCRYPTLLPNLNIKRPTVFLPFITITYAPLLEYDYNFHKSNSTYITDLDASRSNLLSCLCFQGLWALDHDLTVEGKRGMIAAIIGSVTMSFKKRLGFSSSMRCGPGF
ncbi:uncharacterized protein BDW43DRAFT_291400 [Aspergillus alliaceus]|uniref:uncharacterized protein n=1 Tax=Petromyces alliaceus TaxID=209559 RepID=UPI0012A685B9|nr:uncharacterized protein BDW43DRAFT_291400 [Aspergillus alliaceus]KAB8228448.1 hypothetical protein BDW43DRAFT_291400 [Aspergillus alliaceus]